MVSIPRNTQPEIIDNDTTEKINQEYAYGGSTMIINFIEELIDVPIDRYVSINMDGLQELIDIVGGINMTSNETFTVKGNSYVEDNSCDMDGTEALVFTRSCYEDGAGGGFGRQERQQLVVQALVEKLISVGSLGRMNSILGLLGGNVKTNLTMADL